MEDIDCLKYETFGKPTYRLANANVFTSKGGYHYIDYLDPVEQISPIVDESELTSDLVTYIEKSLQSNSSRFEGQAKIVKSHMPNIEGINLLDIGCGGGLFLSKLKSAGARVQGIELSDSRAHYARTRHNLDVVKRPVEDVYWQDFKSSFDIVTLWDVIEHVNFPGSTLKASAELLKTGGLIFIDTPCRDSFYHRIGVFTYKISLGVFPTFLNSMYSAHAFGHKQIFSVKEIEKLLQANNFEIVEIKKFHELSFPYEFYLKNILRHDFLVKASLPLVKLLLTIFPVKNKMLAVGRKK